MMNVRLLTLTVAALVAVSASDARAQGKLNRFGNPPTLAPAPTSPAVTVKDLQIRLYQFADDSMQGRQIGRLGNKKGTDYIAAEMKRLGAVPAGDNGTFFQVLPYHLRQFTNHSRLQVDGNPLAWEKDWVAVPGVRLPRAISNAPVIFGGVAGDTTKQITAAQANGKFVVLLPAPPAPPTAGGRFGFAPPPTRLNGAVAVATINLDDLTAAQRAAINQPTQATSSAVRMFGGRPGGQAAPPDSLTIYRQLVDMLQPQANIRLTKGAAAKLFGRANIDGIPLGTTGGNVTASLDFIELPTEFARNVVAIIPGSDPVLKHQYVAIGAHNDHVGFSTTPVDKDSVKAFNDIRNRLLLANNMMTLDPQKVAAIRVNMDSIRKAHPKPRLDSIRNGADDDGSGSMGVLEIAEYIASMKMKPKRSTLFVWHTGEEAGLIGSSYFVNNPTVPLDSVVAQINIDMIGRGRAEDLPGGGDDYVGVIGSNFDSKDLGEQVLAVNKKQAKPLTLDFKFDTTISWSGYNNLYSRSDHINYARAGIPIAFFFTGLHGDYHQLSDEPEYIDYPHYAKIANYLKDLTVEVGNGPRPRINGTKPSRPPRSAVP
ncbi:MAG: M28 family peptidase [Gemmatimonadaceae bacterium]|nr:M28 family peptidase [Gemmatimonadaceae bacterium]